jgi:hypothetical protein
VLQNFWFESATEEIRVLGTWAGYEGGNDPRAGAECAVKTAAGDRETRWAGDLRAACCDGFAFRAQGG